MFYKIILISFVFDNYASTFHVIKYIWSQMSRYQRRITLGFLQSLGLPYWNIYLYLKMCIVVNFLPEFDGNLQSILSNLNHNPRRNHHYGDHGSTYFVKKFHFWSAVGPGIERFLSVEPQLESTDATRCTSHLSRLSRSWIGGRAP
jgi:hypothetical protein